MCMKLLAIAQHLANLCVICNNETYMDNPETSTAAIKSAMNMACTCGYETEIWMDPFTEEFTHIRVRDIETDEVVVKGIETKFPCTHAYLYHKPFFVRKMHNAELN